jgi:hypothetical protein
MTACMCLSGFQARIHARKELTPAKVRAEWAKLPAECSDTRCTPGGCKANCQPYAAGVVHQLTVAKGKA